METIGALTLIGNWWGGGGVVCACVRVKWWCGVGWVVVVVGGGGDVRWFVVGGGGVCVCVCGRVPMGLKRALLDFTRWATRFFFGKMTPFLRNVPKF